MRAGRRRGLASALVGLAALGGCGPRELPPLGPHPVEYADTLPIYRPKARQLNQVARIIKESVGGDIGRAFSFHRWFGAIPEALNVTPFDDVVNSAWFEHRNGRRPMSAAEVGRGATTVGPDAARGLTVVAGKAQGISPGFTVRDAAGDTYLLKFDPKGNLHLGSAAGVISSRLFYAAGYHTPEDYILVFDRARLALDPGATVQDEIGVERPMTERDIEAICALTDALPDGRFLAIASKTLPGERLGPFTFAGVRPDDPNDYYWHEYRRELRGLYVMSSWLNHVDMRYENTLDVFVSPPGFVRHYLIDFAATLGSGTIRPHKPREGMEYNFDFWATMARLSTLGIYRVGWEERPYRIAHSSLGWMPVEEYDPATWKANWSNKAFASVTPRDGYWGAKLVGSFTDEQLRAAVEQGHLPTRAAADTLVQMLALRRDRTVEHWYARVTPIEEVEARPAADGLLVVEFRDLGIEVEAWGASQTTYEYLLEHPARGISVEGKVRGRFGMRRQAIELDLGAAASPDPERLSDRERIATLRIVARRPRADGRTATVFLRWSGGDDYIVVGLEH